MRWSDLAGEKTVNDGSGLISFLAGPCFILFKFGVYFALEELFRVLGYTEFPRWSLKFSKDPSRLLKMH